MSKPKGNYRSSKGRNKPVVGDKAREVLEKIDENNPVIKLFQQYAGELDAKHDRYERIVKLSRDITIESKRIIFSLHSTYTDIESKKKSVLEEANQRLKNLIQNNFKAIALELLTQDGYMYHRAYTSGLQEFIEAVCFYEFLNTDTISRWSTINEQFEYQDECVGQIQLLFPQYDYILGIADFTGELMRRCINTLGIGNVSECFKLCNFVKTINTGFLGLTAPGNRELGRKAFVLRQSLSKMELVCYNVQIRGSEVPRHVLISVIETSDVTNEDDEGYF